MKSNEEVLTHEEVIGGEKVVVADCPASTCEVFQETQEFLDKELLSPAKEMFKLSFKNSDKAFLELDPFCKSLWADIKEAAGKGLFTITVLINSPTSSNTTSPEKLLKIIYFLEENGYEALAVNNRTLYISWEGKVQYHGG